jgi:hypothetical protein
LKLVLAPDVYVNASVAFGSPPERLVQRVLGERKASAKASDWVLERVASMLAALPAFKAEAVEAQVGQIRQLVEIVPVPGSFGPDAWQQALIALAKAAQSDRIVTDHPDLLALDIVDGIELMSTEAWLMEQTMPPPLPA